MWYLKWNAVLPVASVVSPNGPFVQENTLFWKHLLWYDGRKLMLKNTCIQWDAAHSGILEKKLKKRNTANKF